MAKNTKEQKALDKTHDLIDVELYKVFKKIKSNKHFKKLENYFNANIIIIPHPKYKSSNEKIKS